MSQSDLLITLTVNKQVGAGQVARGQSMAFRLPGNGEVGLTLTAGQKAKLGAALEQLGTVVDSDSQDL